MDKKELVATLRAVIAKEVTTLAAAARDAREAATHEEAKPENDKDTRAVEAAYLAGAQANRVVELEQIANALTFLPLRAFRAEDPIALGALVEVDDGERRSVYFLAPTGGGLRATSHGIEVQVITPVSPMGQALIGRTSGDEIEFRLRGTLRELTITSVT